jgi:hypothetical protein
MNAARKLQRVRPQLHLATFTGRVNRTAARLMIVVNGLLMVIAGCGQPEELEVTYGQRKGTAASSVNGTGVLAAMYEEAGFSAYTWRYLSSGLHDYDVIVWAPDDFGPPSEETREFFDEWLARENGKTLVYIGRDYDAAGHYWQRVLPTAPPDQQLEIRRRLAQSRATHSSRRLQMPANECVEWFTMRRNLSRRQTRQLRGTWSDGIDANETNIWTTGLLEIPTKTQLSKVWKDPAPPIYRQPDFESLLYDGDRTLVTRVTKSSWGDGQVIVVANGSFLLNLPMVNHQHRKLAGKLIEACRPEGKVAFLESGPGGPALLDFAPKQSSSDATRRRVLVAAHWFILGMIYCFSVFPIFGRPKSYDADSQPDFAQHVDALAALLERTRDTQYARRHLDYYRDTARREASSQVTAPAEAASRSAGGGIQHHENRG